MRLVIKWSCVRRTVGWLKSRTLVVWEDTGRCIKLGMHLCPKKGKVGQRICCFLLNNEQHKRGRVSAAAFRNARRVACKIADAHSIKVARCKAALRACFRLNRGHGTWCPADGATKV